MKKILILTLAALFVFTGCSSKGEATEEKEYFDFTVTEFVDTLKDEYTIWLDLYSNFSYEDGTSIARYTYETTNDDIDTAVQYVLSYDSVNKKVSQISVDVDKNFMLDVEGAAFTRFLVHTGVVSSFIDPDTNTEVLNDTIATGILESELQAGIYEGANFSVVTTDMELSESFSAVFLPSEEKTK